VDCSDLNAWRKVFSGRTIKDFSPILSLPCPSSLGPPNCTFHGLQPLHPLCLPHQHGREHWYSSSCLSPGHSLHILAVFITSVWWYKTPQHSSAFHNPSPVPGKGPARLPSQELLQSDSFIHFRAKSDHG